MKKIIYSALLISALFFCSISFSQSIVMKVPPGIFGFKGDVTLTGYVGSIEVLQFSDLATGCPTLPCKVSSSGISIQITNSLAVQDFRSSLFRGEIIREADLIVVPSGARGTPVFEPYRIHMKDIVVVSVSEGTGDDAPIYINIELQPGRMAWRSQVLLADGKTIEKNSSGWDFINHVPFTYF